MVSLVLAGAVALGSAGGLLERELHLEVPSVTAAEVFRADGGVVPACLSFLFPGAGQVYNGEPFKGGLMFLGIGLTAGMGIAIAQVGPGQEPHAGTWVGLGLLGVSMLIYGWSVIDAFMPWGLYGGGDAEPPPAARPVLRAGAGM